MKKYEITFYFDSYNFISLIGFYEKSEDLVNLVTKCTDGTFPYFISEDSTCKIGININKIRYFKIRELGVDSSELCY